MVAARSAAMAFNRILDAEIDARNRRTATAPPSRRIVSARFAWGFTIRCFAVFLFGRRSDWVALLVAVAGSAGHSFRLFVCQALYLCSRI